MRITAVRVAFAAAAFLVAPADESRGRPAALPQDARSAEIEEYTALFVSLAGQALANARLASAMPCLPHWLAGNDQVVVAISDAGAAAGLVRGDTLQRIGGTALTGRADGVWDVAMRALKRGDGYAVDVARNGSVLQLRLPCASDRARQLHAAERAMWTAVTKRDWDACIAEGRQMIRAFGAAFSPPLMIMTRCASAAAGQPDASLSSELGHALLQEMVAHPDPSPDLHEQLLLTLRDLDAIRQAGGADYASALRARMAEHGVGVQ